MGRAMSPAAKKAALAANGGTPRHEVPKRTVETGRARKGASLPRNPDGTAKIVSQFFFLTLECADTHDGWTGSMWTHNFNFPHVPTAEELQGYAMEVFEKRHASGNWREPLEATTITVSQDLGNRDGSAHTMMQKVLEMKATAPPGSTGPAPLGLNQQQIARSMAGRARVRNTTGGVPIVDPRRGTVTMPGGRAMVNGAVVSGPTPNGAVSGAPIEAQVVMVGEKPHAVLIVNGQPQLVPIVEPTPPPPAAPAEPTAVIPPDGFGSGENLGG